MAECCRHPGAWILNSLKTADGSGSRKSTATLKLLKVRTFCLMPELRMCIHAYTAYPYFIFRWSFWCLFCFFPGSQPGDLNGDCSSPFGHLVTRWCVFTHRRKVQVCVVYAVVQPGSLEMTHTHRQAERIVGFLIFFSNICYCFVATFWSCTSWYYVAKSL